MLPALIGRSLGRARGLLLGLVTLLCGLQFLLAIVARELQGSQAFKALTALVPGVFQQAMGSFFFGSYGGMVSFGFVHPVVVLVLVEAAIFLGSEPAWEIESGIVDLTMARPVPRGLATVRTLAIVFGATGCVLLLMLASTRIAAQLFAPAGTSLPRLRTSVMVTANLLAVTWWFGALSLLVAAIVRRRSQALGIAGLSAVFLYLFNFLAEVWPQARAFRFFTPFHYYNAPGLLMGSEREWPAHMTLLLVTTAILCVAAWRMYEKRDL
jgi:ABC-2 type transport system permease protein